MTFYPFLEGKVFGFLLFFTIFLASVYYYATKKEIFLRKLPAIEAIDEAVGRAAEMGRPIICSYGDATLGMDFWTIAGLNVLEYTASLSVSKGTELYVPLAASSRGLITQPIATEIVKNAHRLHGDIQNFNEEEHMRIMGSDWHNWAMNYSNMLYELQPAANIYVGFIPTYGLYLAESSRSIPGCMTIGSSFYLGMVALIAISCDYVFIAQDIVAAGAYASKSEDQKGFLRVLDITSVIAIVIITCGSLLLTAGISIMTWIGV